MSAGSELALLISAQDQSAGAFGSVKGHLSSLASAAGAPVRAIGGITDALGKLGLAGLGVKTVADALGGLVSGLAGPNAQFETYQTQFGVLLGGADAAQQRIEELAQFGADTPFELPGVVEADKILQAFGFHADDAKQKFGYAGDEIRTIAGDVASGAGASFSEISTYLGKFASGSTGEAIMRFSELGIVTRQELAGMGLEFSKSGELLSPLPEATETLLTAMKQKYGGMMDAQSKTFEGMSSNLSDWIGNTKRKLTQPIFEALKDKLATTLEFLSSPEVSATLDNVANMIAGGVGGAVDLAGKAFDSARNIITGLIDVWGQLSSAFQTGGIEGALGKLGGMIGNVFASVDWNAVLSTIGQKLGDAGAWIGDIAGTVSDYLGQEWAKIDWGAVWSNVQGFGEGLKNQITSIDWAGVLDSLGSMTEPLREKLAPIGEFLQPLLDTFGSSLGDLGGYLQDMGDRLAPLGEAFGKLAEKAQPFLTFIAMIAGGAIATAIGVIAGAINGIIEALPAVIDMIMGIVQGITEVISGVMQFFGGIGQIIQGIIQIFQGDFLGGFQTILGGFGEMAGGILGIFQGLWDTVSSIFTGAFSTITGFVSGFISGIVGWFTSLWDQLVGHSIIPDMMDAIVGFFQGLPDRIMGFVSGLVGTVVGWFTSMATDIVGPDGKVTKLISDIVGFFTGLPGKLGETIGAILGKAGEIGNAIREGIAGGLEGAIGVVGDLTAGILNGLKSLINRIIDAVNNAIPNDIGLDILGQRVAIDFPDNPIPRLAAGGIVTRPTLALIGERGPEAILPLTSGRGQDIIGTGNEEVIELLSNILAVLQGSYKQHVQIKQKVTFRDVWGE